MAEFYDWVSDRAKCNAIDMFLALKADAERDVKSRNAISPADAQYAFRVKSFAEGRFTVTLDWNQGPTTVEFLLDGQEIRIRDGGETVDAIVATVTLNNDKECRLVVKGEELERWQVRRMALERLLFGTV